MTKPTSTVMLVAFLILAGGGLVVFRGRRPIPAAPRDPQPAADSAAFDPVATGVPSVSLGVPGPVVPVPKPAADRDTAKRMDEASLLAKLHDLGLADPLLSLKLAREALDRFPGSPNAPEFEWNAVKALFNMGRIEDAKEEARVMRWRYPNSNFTSDVDRHLLHPQPNQSPSPE